MQILGFALDEENGHLVSICAIDNLMKGASGTAVQCMNLMMGWDEMTWIIFSWVAPGLDNMKISLKS